MKKYLLPLFLIFLAGKATLAQGSHIDTFKQGNLFYENHQLQKAIETYELLVEQNQKNAFLYYNLGNAYYKNQQLGYALVNYERALKLSPRDSDIRHNINFIREVLNEPPLPFWEQVLSQINNLITLNGLTVLCSGLYIILIIGLCLFLFRRHQWLMLFNGMAFCVLLSAGIWLAFKINYEVTTRWAIVISGPSDVRNGPGEENSIGFTIPEGKKVVILGEKDEWTAIGLKTEGLKGWIEKKYIEKI